MKILVLSDLYPPYYLGGHEIQCKVVADGLARFGHEVSVLTSRFGSRGEKSSDKIFRSLHYLNDFEATGLGKRMKQLSRALLGRSNYKIARRIVRDLKPDIVYAGQLSGISLFPLKAIKREGIPVMHDLGIDYLVHYVEDCVLNPSLLRRYYRKVILGLNRISDCDFENIIVISQDLKARHVRVGFCADKITVIPRGIPSDSITTTFKKSPARSGGPVKLLYVGRLCAEKGVDISLRALGHLRGRPQPWDFVLDIIGGGEKRYIGKLLLLAEELGLKQNVRFLGTKTRGEVFLEYARHDILLVPSVWEEPFGLVIIEAMSQGLPVIATRVGGIPEIIKNETSGLLVPPNDSQKMAEAVEKLVGDVSFYETLSGRAIRQIREEFSNEVVISRINDHLVKVLKHHLKKTNRT